MSKLKASFALIFLCSLSACSVMKPVEISETKSESLTVTPSPEIAGKGSAVGTFTKFNVIKSFSALVKTPISTGTKNAYYNGVTRLGLLPLLGEPSSLNSPALNFLTIAATEHCNDLIKAEAVLAADKRQMLGNYDLAAKSSNLTEEKFVEAGAIFANAFWGRAPDGEEVNATKVFFSSLAEPALLNTQKLTLVCAGELVSLASITR